jgi:hypothetical protein
VCSFDLKVAFEGVVGSSFTSDIAIDEIYFKSGRCSSKTGMSRTFYLQFVLVLMFV